MTKTKDKQLNTRVSDEVYYAIKSTKYPQSEYIRLAIEKALWDIPTDLQVKKGVLEHSIQQTKQQIKMLTKQLEKEEQSLVDVKQKIIQCKEVADKIKSDSDENKEQIAKAIETVQKILYNISKGGAGLTDEILYSLAKDCNLKVHEFKEILRRNSINI